MNILNQIYSVLYTEEKILTEKTFFAIENKMSSHTD